MCAMDDALDLRMMEEEVRSFPKKKMMMRAASSEEDEESEE